jgi:hypothetical protein
MADLHPSIAVLETLGRVTSLNPHDLPRLDESVDRDALDALCTNPTSPVDLDGDVRLHRSFGDLTGDKHRYRGPRF